MECPPLEDEDGFSRDPKPEDFGLKDGRPWTILDDEGLAFRSEVEASEATWKDSRRLAYSGSFHLQTILVRTDEGSVVVVEYGYSPS